jgi:uncharacterized membrane protein YhfC
MALNPVLIVSYLVAAGIEIAFPLLAGFWLVRRFHLHWVVFAYGFAVFLLSQIVTRVPAVQVISAFFGKELTATPEITFIWYAVLALTAGLFEEIGRWLGYRWFFRREPRTWANALLYGTGHAACESIILVGLAVLLALVNYVILSTMSPATIAAMAPAQQEQVKAALAIFGGLQGWEPLLGAVERIFTLFFHVGAAVLVLQAFTRHNNIWLLLAIAWHALVDFGTIMFQSAVKNAILTEGVIGVVAIISLVIILRLRPTAPEAVTAEPAPLLSLAPAEGTGADVNPARLSLAPAGSTEPPTEATAPPPAPMPIPPDEPGAPPPA